MNNAMDFLLWVRGPALNIAVAVFVIGVLLRLLEIFLLGRRPDYAEPRGGGVVPGMRTVFTRFAADRDTLGRAPVTVIGGYIWHVGFFVCLLLFIPHIEFFGSIFGITWPGLPNPAVDAVSVVTIVTLAAMLLHRLNHPVMRHLSTFEDYLVWAVTLLPLMTGYIAYHRLVDPYPLVLGIHILSVELLLIVIPFTKLIHAITALIARWHNGANFGRKGVES